MSQKITPAIATLFARIALGHVEREYPNKLDQVLNGPADLRGPRDLHPIFYGSFDWHSCVHSYWLLARLRRLHPGLELAESIAELFNRNLTEEKVAGELAFLKQPLAAGFERPYGWAWLLMLAAELLRDDSAQGRRWSHALVSLTAAFVERFRDFLPKLTYPIRTGTHHNTAFALLLAADYADAAQDRPLRELLAARAMHWFGQDRAAPAWEPGGDDFLSATLVEAACMRRFMEARAFNAWFADFLPDLASGSPAVLFHPASVSDRSDGKIAHLDGLNLSRAWCMRLLAAELADADPRRRVLLESAQCHVDLALPHLAADYMGEHWLATYALLALELG